MPNYRNGSRDDELPEDLGGFAGAPTLAAIEHWKRLGYSEAAIARRYNRTRADINWHVQYYGGTKTARQIVLEHFPFVVSGEQGQTAPFKNLRNHGEFMVTHGVGMSEDKLRRLRGFYRHLRENELVLEHDPAIPPTPGVSNKGGWAYRDRTSADGNLLVRDNEYADLTEFGRTIWRFPIREP